MDSLPIIINFALPLTAEVFKNIKLLVLVFVEAVLAVEKRLNSKKTNMIKRTFFRNKGN